MRLAVRHLGREDAGFLARPLGDTALVESGAALSCGGDQSIRVACRIGGDTMDGTVTEGQGAPGGSVTPSGVAPRIGTTGNDGRTRSRAAGASRPAAGSGERSAAVPGTRLPSAPSRIVTER